MASHAVFMTCFILFFFIFRSSSSSDDSEYQTLDVSATLKQALQVFSKNHNKQKADATNPFSVPLYSRPLHPSEHDHTNNYTALTLARLTRHQSRVNSIFSVLSLTTPVQSALPLGMGEYVTEIGVGEPPKPQPVIMDTGSDITWIQCQPCLPFLCYFQREPIYNPSASKSYVELSCSSAQCASGGGAYCSYVFKRCAYQVTYGDGSRTSGSYATETFHLGETPVADVAFGCGHFNSGLFRGVSGLMGLGGGSPSLPSQIKATSFSYCMVNRDSTNSSTLEFNNPMPDDAVITTLVVNPAIKTYRYIEVEGMNVGGLPVPFSSPPFRMGSDGSGGVILDSGTTITSLLPAAYAQLKAAFVAKALALNLQPTRGFSILDTCYTLPLGSNVYVPTVSFVFDDGKILNLPAANILIPVDNMGTFCFAFARSTINIIGNVQQQGMRVTYDLTGQKVGFSPNKC